MDAETKALRQRLAVLMCKSDDNDVEDWTAMRVYRCYATIAINVLRRRPAKKGKR